MSNQEFEILKSRIQGLSAKIEAVTILASNQEQRSFQDNNNLNRFNEAGVTNPFEQDIDANNFDVENIKDFSATNGKFISLKVGDNNITGDSAAGGILIQVNGTETEVSRGSGAQAITTLDFRGLGVSVGDPTAISGSSDFIQAITISGGSLNVLKDLNAVVMGNPLTGINFTGSGITSVVESTSLGAPSGTVDITINRGSQIENNGTSVGSGILYNTLNFKGSAISSVATKSGTTNTLDIQIDQNSSSGPDVSAINADNAVLGAAANSASGIRFQGDIINTVTNSSGVANVSFHAPETVANAEANRGTTVKNLVDSGATFEWNQCADSVGGITQYSRFGGLVPDTIAGADSEHNMNASCVALSDDGKFMVVGAPAATFNTGDDGYITLWKYAGGYWTIMGRRVGAAHGAIVARGDTDGDASRNGLFGYSVAINREAGIGTGKHIIVTVGEPGGTSSGAGKLHIFRYNTNSSAPSGNGAMLEADNSNFNLSTAEYLEAAIDGVGSSDGLGMSVAVNSNGTMCAAGAPGRASVYIYRREFSNGALCGIGDKANGWSQKIVIGQGAPSSSEPDSNIHSVGGAWSGAASFINGYGTSISLDGSGFKLATSYKHYNAGGGNEGIIRVYEIASGFGTYDFWGYTSDPHVQTGLTGVQVNSRGEQLGTSVKLSADGNIVAAGASEFYGAGLTSGDRSARIRIFKKDSSGSTPAAHQWNDYGSIEPNFIYSIGNNTPPSSNQTYTQFRATSGANSSTGNPSSNQFGRSIDMSSDGNIICVGQSGFDRIFSNQGMVRVFYYSGDGSSTHTWDQFGVTLHGSGLDAYFGRCLALNKDGSRLAISSPNDTNMYQTPSGNNRRLEHHGVSRNDGESEGIVTYYCLNTKMNPLDTRRLSTFLTHFS